MKLLNTIIAVAALATLCSGNIPGQYEINGEIERIEGMVYLVADGLAIDSSAINGGRFRFEGAVREPFAAMLRTADATVAYLFIEEGNISVTGSMSDPSSIQVLGTPLNYSHTRYLQQKQTLFDRLFSGGLSPGQAEELLQAALTTDRRIIDENRDNVLGAYIFGRKCAYDMKVFEIYRELDRFPEHMRGHQYLAEAEMIAQMKMHSYDGEPYYPVTLYDPQGRVVPLEDHIGKGRFTLIEFWASWCGSCVMEIPTLVEAYRKYRDDGFEIYSISLNGQKEDWTASIEKYGIDGWINVSSSGGWQCPAALRYGVRGIPSSFLVAPDGNIIARDLRGSELLEKLSEIYDQ